MTADAIETTEARQAAPIVPVDFETKLLAQFDRDFIDAMIENSGGLTVGADEWLTVAARDGEPGNRLVPGDSYDQSTSVLRVKGTDLAASRAGRLTLEETRRKVEVREN